VEGLEPPKCCTKCCGDPKGLLYGFLPITVEDRLPEGFAQERWDAIGDCSCCEYKNRDVACGSNACYCLCKSCPVYCQESTARIDSLSDSAIEPFKTNQTHAYMSAVTCSFTSYCSQCAVIL